VLWTRETEAGGFDTPERRAALEARIREVTSAIGDETVRKYYRSDLGGRLRRLFEPEDRPKTRGRANSEWRVGNRSGKIRRHSAPAPRSSGATRHSPFATRSAGGPYVVLSPQLQASPILRGHRAAIARREALILLAVTNHPWLLVEHLETLAAVEFRHPDAEKVKAALVDIGAHDGAADGDAMRTELGRRGLADLVGRIERSITTSAVWGARPDAAPADVLMTWSQLIALHRQWHSLIKELKDAEQALGQDPTEAHYSWLQDVKARLSVVEGTEALVEGFGASSGRAAQSF
jgi:DNA primase